MSTIIETIKITDEVEDPLLLKKKRHYEYRVAYLKTEKGREESRAQALEYYYRNREKVLAKKQAATLAKAEAAALNGTTIHSAYYEANKEKLKAYRRARWASLKV